MSVNLYFGTVVEFDVLNNMLKVLIGGGGAKGKR